jgi:Domain of unknown function (DUF5664)
MPTKKCRSIACPNNSELYDFCADCVAEVTCSKQQPQIQVQEALNFTEPPTAMAYEPKREHDPSGRDPHQPGAKVDAGKVRMHLITGGMARAIMEVAKVATFGAAKYTDGGWVDVPDGFRRYEDAQQRHAAYRHTGEVVDPDSQLLHLAHEAWNAIAKLDLYLRAQP